MVRAAAFGAVVGLPVGLLFSGEPGFFWRDPTRWMFRAAGTGVLFSLSFYVMCGLPGSYVIRYVSLRPQRRGRLLIFGTGVLGAALGTMAVLVAVAVVRGGLTPQLIRLAIADGIIAMVLLLALAAWHSLKAEKRVAEVRAQNHALQAQMNPHFFFNTLNTISSLIATDPAAAQRTVAQLAEMSRYAFVSSSRPLVPFPAELSFTRAYVEIERSRFGDRLFTDVPDPGGHDGLTLPPLSLQPLVENAIRHGVAKRLEGGRVSVTVERNSSSYRVVVENDVLPGLHYSEQQFFRPNHALYNIRERLRLAYAEKSSIRVELTTPSRLAVTVEIPLK